MVDLSKQVVDRFEQLKSETERTNFENIWQTASQYCFPPNDNINQTPSAGERKPIERLIDVGIKSNRVFATGIVSLLTPAGSRYFQYDSGKPLAEQSDDITRYFNEVTRITYDVLNDSNFFQEFTKAINSLGYIGNCCIMAEPSNTGITFRTHSIDKYYIDVDSNGEVDTIIFELPMTSRQMVQEFGDQVSAKVLKESNNPKKCDTINKVIHSVYPRADFKPGTALKSKKRIASIYVEYEGHKLIKETGYDTMPYAVGRFYLSSFEKYGRSPALEVLSTLTMLNSMEMTRLRAAQRVSDPPWLSPNDHSTRNISNRHGSIIYYDAANPASKPEQLTVKDNPGVCDAIINSKNEEVEDAFFIPLFNPLFDRRNMTATEVNQRISISMQNIIPAVGRLQYGLMAPLFKRIYEILQKQGLYPVPPEALTKDNIKVTFTSKAQLAIKQLELEGTYNTLERATFLAKMDPTVMDNFDMDAVAQLTAQAQGVPNIVLRSEYDVSEIRQKRNADNQAQQSADVTSQMADAYSKTTQRPDVGSGADLLLQEAGL